MPHPIAILAPVAFAAGALAGRWIDAAAQAIPAGRRWTGRPSCAACGSPWRGRVLLPVAGPLLTGRCPVCAAPIPVALPLTETAAGLLFALAVARCGTTPVALAHATAVGLRIALLLTIARIDWRHHLIFDRMVGWGLLGAFGYAATLSPRPHALHWALGAALGAAGFFIALYLLALIVYRRRALGFGDVLLAALIGAATGPAAPLALFTGMIMAAVGGLVLVIARRRGLREYLPYGSFLCAGAIAALLLRCP